MYIYSSRKEQQVMIPHVCTNSLPSAVITVMGTLGALNPTLFTATTCTEYSVNGVRPSTYSSVVFVLNTSDVFPLSSSTTCNVMWYIRIGALLSDGSSHEK